MPLVLAYLAVTIVIMHHIIHSAVSIHIYQHSHIVTRLQTGNSSHTALTIVLYGNTYHMHLAVIGSTGCHLWSSFVDIRSILGHFLSFCVSDLHLRSFLHVDFCRMMRSSCMHAGLGCVGHIIIIYLRLPFCTLCLRHIVPLFLSEGVIDLSMPFKHTSCSHLSTCIGKCF